MKTKHLRKAYGFLCKLYTHVCVTAFNATTNISTTTKYNNNKLIMIFQKLKICSLIRDYLNKWLMVRVKGFVRNSLSKYQI